MVFARADSLICLINHFPDEIWLLCLPVYMRYFSFLHLMLWKAPLTPTRHSFANWAWLMICLVIEIKIVRFKLNNF